MIEDRKSSTSKLDTRTISVVIPALDEEDCIARALESAKLGMNVELIVADADSHDRTAEIARSHGALVLRTSRQRARQMNAGAAAARGEILLFLHADTVLPLGWDRCVRDLLAGPRVVAGAFRLRLEPRTPLLALIERGANIRARWLRLPYGDQAIFVRSSVFAAAGGYPEIQAMEDFALMRKLGASGHIAIAPCVVVSSARRWLTRGVARTTLVNMACMLAYLGGVHPARIASWR